jgi:predicted PurR-regulated permease PerM
MNSPVQVTSPLRIFIGVVLTVAVMRYAEDIFIPVALALLMTFVLAPIVELLQRWHVRRTLAVTVSVAVAVVLLGTLIYVIIDQVTDVLTQLPRYRQQLRANLKDLSGFVTGGMSNTTAAVEQLTREINRVAPNAAPTTQVPSVRVVEPPLTVVQAIGNMIGPFMKPVGMAAIVIVFTIFMLLRLPDLRDRVIRLVGMANVRNTTHALSDAAERVSRYLLTQLLINSWQGICVSAGLWFIGVPNFFLWGGLAVILRFIPYVGPWIAATMPIALAFAVFDDFTKPLLVVLLFIVVELMSNMVLEPWLYGRNTGVSPLSLLLATTFWTWLWGAAGLFLAVPLTVCLMVMGKHLPTLQFLYVLLGDAPLDPHELLYQRLLAGRREEADALLAEALRQRSARRVCDDVLIAAVRLAERDHARGNLDEAQCTLIRELFHHWKARLVEGKLGAGPLRRLTESEARVSGWRKAS